MARPSASTFGLRGVSRRGLCDIPKWVDEIMHYLFVLVCTGESSFRGFLGGAGFRPSAVGVHFRTLVFMPMEFPNEKFHLWQGEPLSKGTGACLDFYPRLGWDLKCALILVRKHTNCPPGSGVGVGLAGIIARLS